MKYSFTMDPGLREHELEADITITPGVAGDAETPAEGPQLECNGVWMVRGDRRRKIVGKLSADVEDHLVERTHEILKQWADESREAAADAWIKREQGE